MRDEPLKIGVLISGSGTNLQAIIDAVDAGTLNCEVAKVLSSRPDAYGLQRAQAAGIPIVAFDRSVYADPIAADERIVDEMRSVGVEYVVMAGYMRMVRAPLLEAYPNRILNLHPALLPSFVGAHAIQDAFDAGVKITGVTVHVANAAYDRGPIIAQRAVEVREDDTVDTLEARIHGVEHELYPEVLRWLADGRVTMGNDGKAHIG
jgi:phosphoribosylglycinamide formyltransferase-1